MTLYHFFTSGYKRGGYAIKTPSFEVEEGECRQRPLSILWFGGSCSSIVVLTTPLYASVLLVSPSVLKIICSI